MGPVACAQQGAPSLYCHTAAVTDRERGVKSVLNPKFIRLVGIEPHVLIPEICILTFEIPVNINLASILELFVALKIVYPGRDY